MKSRNAVCAIAAVVFGGAFQRSGAWAACDPSGTNQTCENSEVLTGAIAIFDNNLLTLLNTNAGVLDGSGEGIWSTRLDLENFGIVHGGAEGIFVSDGADIVNYGEITGGNDGVYSTNFLNATNYELIEGGLHGIFVTDGSGALADIDNYGTIRGAWQGIFADNIDIDNYGDVLGGFGILADVGDPNGGTATVRNWGNIIGADPATDSYGLLADEVYLTNAGLVSGGFLGVGANVSATIVNSGQIVSTGVGAGFNDSGIGSRGTLDLTNSGAIIGSTGVTVSAAEGSSLVNSGLIRGTGGIAIDLTGASISAGTPSTNSDLLFLAGSRIDGDIMLGDGDEVDFRSGNDIAWLTTVTPGGAFSITGGGAAPYVIDETTGQFVTLDATAYAMTDRALLALTNGIGSVVDDRLAGEGELLSNGGADSSDSDLGFGFWASGFGGLLSQEGEGPNLDADFSFGGGLVGFESRFGGGSKFGLFAGGGYAALDVGRNSQSIDSDFFTGGTYGRLQAGNAFLGLSLSGGFGGNDSDRLVANNQVDGMFEAAEGSYDSYFVSPAVQLGYDIATAAGTVWTPSASLRFLYADLDGYDESGSAQNLSIGDRTVQDLEGRLEIARRQGFAAPSGGVIDTELRAGLISLTRLGDTDVDGALLGQDIAFDVTGDDSAFGGFLGAGLAFDLTAWATLSFDVEASLMTESILLADGQVTLEIAF